MPFWTWSAARGFINAPDDARFIKGHTLVNLTSYITHQPRNFHLLSNKQFHSCRGGGLNVIMSDSMPHWKVPQKDMLHSIYNPFTGVSFQLPSRILDDEGMEYPMTQCDITQLSSQPPNCLVAVYFNSQLCICRPGDDHWMKDHRCYPPIHDMIFYKGELYCILEGQIVAYDLEAIYATKFFSHASPRDVLCYQWSKIYQSEWPYLRDHYLVESGGDLMVVTKILKAKEFDEELEFVVHRIDQDEGKMVPQDVLVEDRFLLVGRGCSYSCFMLNKDVVYEHSSFFTKNCIYTSMCVDLVHLRSGMFSVIKYPLSLNKEEVMAGTSSVEVRPDYHLGRKCGTIWFPPTFLPTFFN